MALTLDGTNGIVSSGSITTQSSSGVIFSDSSALTAASSPYVLKNRIINGAFGVAQRGTSFTPSANANTYTLDRWAANRNTVANYTVSQQGTSGAYSLRLQRNSGDTSTENLRLRQVIETCNCADMAGLSATLSLTITAGANYSGGSNCYLSICTGSGIDQGLSSMVSNSWTNWLEQYTNITPTTTATTYKMTVTIPAGTNEIGILLQYTPSGTAGANDWLQFTNIQLEVGSTATPFERRLYGNELALCQRYYFNDFTYCQGSFYSTTAIVGTNRLPVTMRASPTISLTSGTTVATDVVGGSSSTMTPSFSYITPNSFRYSGTNGSSSSIGASVNITSSTIQASAEL